MQLPLYSYRYSYSYCDAATATAKKLQLLQYGYSYYCTGTRYNRHTHSKVQKMHRPRCEHAQRRARDDNHRISTAPGAAPGRVRLVQRPHPAPRQHLTGTINGRSSLCRTIIEVDTIPINKKNDTILIFDTSRQTRGCQGMGGKTRSIERIEISILR